MTRKDNLPGGLADKHDVKSIADYHGVSVEEIEKQVEMGIKVELEHTDDPKLAREIALDHIAEMPDYYNKLKKIEPHHEQKLREVIRKEIRRML